MIPLSEELVHIRSYLEIQNLRFLKEIKLELDVPKELESVMLPRITLQPIVENAVIHGICKCPNKSGVIRISARRQADDVEISIWDNGIGISQESLMKLYSDKSGYGMKNVRERIRLQFGQRYGLHIDTKLNEYTEIKLFVPYYAEEAEG